jgi:MFS transporter, YQGE family, putative transporter
MNRLLAEYRVLASCSREMRALLLANAIYAMVLPVIEIFVAAYVLRHSQHASKVLVYQLCIYAATPVAFLLNGYLLRLIAVNYLYAAGMLLSGGALVVLMTADIKTAVGIAVSGGLMGLATGIFWANRGFLALSTTTDANRNYFYGIETCVITITSVIVPLGVGALLQFAGSRDHFAGRELSFGYRYVAAASLLLTILASTALLRGEFRNPPVARFIFFRFDPLWYRMLGLAALRGVAQGYIITAPALLILRFVGQEGVLGKIEAVGSCIAAVGLYTMGRLSRREHRVRVLTVALVLFLAGAVFNALLFDSLGVLIFMGCLLLAKPMIDLAYYPIQLHTVDVVSRIEGRSEYAYILNHEFGLFAGRFVGCTLFIGIAVWLSETDALRYALPIVAILQLPAILLARKLSV